MIPQRKVDTGPEVDASDFFETLAAVLPGVVYQSLIGTDGTLKIQYINDATRWILELEPEEIMNDPKVFRNLVHPDERETFLRRVNEMLPTGGLWKHEYRLRLPSGRVIWISSHASVTLLEGGLTLWRGFFTDVTAQKVAQEAQDFASAMLARTQQVAGLGTWSFDYGADGPLDEAGGKLWWSDETFRLLGYEPGTVEPTSELFFNLVHPDDRARIRAISQPALVAGRDYAVEFRANLPTGFTRYFNEAVEVRVGIDGKVTGILGTLLDVTDRRRAEADLEAERERLFLATRAGHVGTWDYDVRTQHIRWNDIMYEIHGVTPETYTPCSQENYKFLPAEDRERVKAAFMRCLASGSDRYSVDVNLILKDGQRRLTRSHAVIIRDPAGEPLRVVGIEMDITEEQRAAAALAAARDAAEAATRAKSEFLATMSHEIRTPMNGVLGYTALLKGTTLDDEQRDYLSVIEASGEHLLEVINDILDVSRIEAGGLEIEIDEFELRACVREIFEMLRPVATRKALAYRCHIDEGVPRGIRTDRSRLAQILTNVLGNAIKFTDRGEVEIDISARRHDGSGSWRWEFRVRDTGPGIPKQAMDHIFRPFYQADSSSRRKHGGTGLGLAISSRMAELMNGSLSVENRPSGGCDFLLVIYAEAAGAIPTDLVRVEGPALAGGAHVLVVEDNPVNRRLCELQLHNLGCTARFAGTGHEAVERYGKERFDVVLMDMQLPGLDGCEATREIRRQEEVGGARRTPIVAMTANARVEDRERCLAAGMDDYLSKPTRQEALAAMLAKWRMA